MSFEQFPDLKGQESYCIFGQRLIYSGGPSYYEKKILAHQVEFAHEDIGDQIDEDYQRLLFLVGPVQGEEHSQEVEYVAKDIANCLRMRYLGICSISNCGASKIVGNIINDI